MDERAHLDLVAEIQHELEGLTSQQIEEKARLVRRQCDKENWPEDERREYSMYVWWALEKSPRVTNAEVDQRIAAWLRGFGVDATQFAADLVAVVTAGEEAAIKRGQGDQERLLKFWSLRSMTGPSSVETEGEPDASKKPN